MSIEEFVLIIFSVFSVWCTVYLFIELLKDTIFYVRNGWNFDQRRKNSVEVYDGDLPSETPLKGRGRYFGIVSLVIMSSIFAGVLVFGLVVPALMKLETF